MTTDASKNAISGVLSPEVHPSNPVIYVSRRLSAPELLFSNTEREALAIVYVIGRLQQFLQGRKLNLITNHKPLEFIFAPSRLSKKLKVGYIFKVFPL